MPQVIDPRTREILKKYLRDVRSLPNEAARRQRFSALVAELFPGTNAVTEFSRGVEKRIRIHRKEGEQSADEVMKVYPVRPWGGTTRQCSIPKSS